MSVIVDNGFCVNTVGSVQKTSLALVVTGAICFTSMIMIMITIMRIRENYENDPLADQWKQNCSSLFMCIPRHLGCNGELNCLEGDASDETGCKTTSRIIMMMMMMMMMRMTMMMVMMMMMMESIWGHPIPGYYRVPRGWPTPLYRAPPSLLKSQWTAQSSWW